jgi:hypothetical protein
VTIISLSSLCGAFVIPLSNSKIYKKILMFLIGIAVGSLAGSGFLHLIPQVFARTQFLFSFSVINFTNHFIIKGLWNNRRSKLFASSYLRLERINDDVRCLSFLFSRKNNENNDL